jgi:hypothetical protein
MVLTWQEAGPAPIYGGFNVAVPSNAQVGAITSILTHPTDPNTLWVGAVNGGIWRSTDATNANPTWTPVTDDSAPSLSVGALDLDPRSPQNLVAGGFGNFSSSARRGGILPGLLLSSDGGQSWQLAADQTEALKDLSISGVVIRGQTIVVTANTQARRDRVGVNGFARSVDGGRTFTALKQENFVDTPAGFDPFTLQMTDLAGDRAPAENLFAASLSGVFVSSDLGGTWKDLTKGILALNSTAFDEAVKVRLAVGYYPDQPIGRQTVMYVGIVSVVENAAQQRRQRLTGVYRTNDLGATWTRLDLPSALQDNPDPRDVESSDTGLTSPGIHPGGQGGIHFSIGVDPQNPNLVYVGGDRQPAPINGTNATGARAWTGHLFQGDASKPAGQQWTPITNKFANNTAPHADSRDIAFDLNGNLLQSDDGGIYRYSPVTQTWASLFGSSPNQFAPTLRLTEFISADWDSNTDLIIGGAQDNGVSVGRLDFSSATVAGLNWTELAGGDGGMVRVDDVNPDKSYQYYSAQSLGNFSYREMTTATQQAGNREYIRLIVQGANLKLQDYERTLNPNATLPFTTPIAVNTVASGRLVIGTNLSVYESLDRGNQLVDLFLTDPTNTTSERRYTLEAGEAISTMVYGGRVNGVAQPEMLYVGTTRGRLFRRDPGGVLTAVNRFGQASILDLAINPNNPQELYLLTSTRVWRSLDGGRNFTNLTGNLTVGNGSLVSGRLQTLEFIPSEKDQGLIVGGLGGTRSLINPGTVGANPITWRKFGEKLPNLNIMDLNYDSRDDVLVAATLGRGAWFATSVKAEFGGVVTAAPGLPFNPLVNRPAVSVQNTTAPEQVSTYLGDDIDDDDGEFLEDGVAVPALEFEVRLNGRSTTPVTVRVFTADRTAIAGVDYEPVDLVLTFAPGETLKQVRVPILNDALNEPDETLELIVLEVQGAAIADGVGVGIIETDPGEFAPDALPTLAAPNWSFVGLMPTANGASSQVLWRNSATGNNLLWQFDETLEVNQLDLTALRDPNWIAAGTADFTQDGNPDIFWYNNQTGATQIWEMKGQTLVAINPLAVNTIPGWTVSGLVDLTGDNQVDVIWRDPISGVLGWWAMNRTQFVGSNVIASVDVSWKIRAIADFTGDGQADFLWQNDNGTVVIWQMNGVNIAGVLSLPTLSPTQVIAGVADFDGDDQLDLLIHEYESRQTTLWYLDHGRFDEDMPFEVAESPTWRAQAIADVDGDDQVDILWRDIATGENALWLLD